MKKKFSIVLTAVLCLTLVLSFVADAYDLPQKYSSDNYTEPAKEVVVPGEPVAQDGILTYLNDERIPLSVKPRFDGDVLYVPIEDFFYRVGMTVSKDSGYTVSNSEVTATFKSGSDKVTVNGKEVTIEAKVKRIKGVDMCPANLIAEVLNAKVWFDEDSQTFVVSTGDYKEGDILRVINYKFWMNGEPYYELSFNKFDLFRQIASYYNRTNEWSAEEDTLPAAEAALKQLSELGMKTIRVFIDIPQRAAYIRSEFQREKYYEIMDTAFDLCDKYGIQVNCCMNLFTSDFSPSGEDYFDLMCNPESQSRKNLYSYLETFIARYMNRHSVMMWEIVNEGNLEADVGWAVKSARPSLYQIGEFYADVAAKIHEIDPNHLVTGGDSCLRDAQWHLYLGTKEGKVGCDWTQDTLEDRLKAYVMLYHGLDVISGHCYSTGLGNTAFVTSADDPTTVKSDFNLLMSEARRVGKVFYNGETAVNADTFVTESGNPELLEQTKSYIQDIINAGVQISHWWTFRNNTKTHKVEGYGWDISYGCLLDAILEGNKQLKETYVVNKIANAYTNNAWGDSKTVVTSGVTSVPAGVELPKGCGASVSGEVSVVCVIIIAAAAVLVLKKRRNSAK